MYSSVRFNEIWYRTCRTEGAPLPASELNAVPWTAAALHVRDVYDPWGLRTVRTATMKVDSSDEAESQLFDVHLLHMGPEGMVLGGFERDVLTRKDVAQTWQVTGFRGPFWCLRTKRGGAPVARWQQSQAPWLRGQIQMAEGFDEALRRTVRVARLLGEDGQDVVPALRETQLVALDHDRMLLCGSEREPGSLRDVSQVWLLMGGEEEPGGAGVAYPD